MSEPPAGAGAGPAPVVARDGFEIGEIPYPHEIRRFTARAAGARATASPVELLTDLAAAVVGALVVVAVTAGVVGRSREALEVGAATTPAATDGTGLQLVVLALAVGAAGALLSLAARTGPVGVGGPAGQWWLPLAVERRGLVRPAAARTPALAAAAGALGVAVVVLVLPGTTPAGAAASGLVGGLVAATLVLAAGLAQTVDRQALVRRVGDGLVALVAVVLVLASLAGAGAGDGARAAPTGVGLVAVVAVGSAVVALAAQWLDRRLGLLRASSLRAGGAAGAQALGGAVSLDLREVGRALTDSSTPSRRRRSLRLRSARGPASALLTGDVVALVRSPWHLVELMVALALPVVATRVPELRTTVPLFLAVVLGGGLASVAAVEPARRAQATSGVDRLLPLAAGRVRALRLVLPVVVLLVWSGLALGAVGAAHGAPGDWVSLGVLGAPVWAAAGLRAAYRPPPDWGGPLMTTAAGAVPVGVVGVLVHGPDLAALGLVPTWVALGLGGVTAPLLVGQAVLAVVAVAVGTSSSTTTLAQRVLGSTDDGPSAGAQGMRAREHEKEDGA